MSGPICEEKVRKSLEGFGNFDIDLEKGRVIIKSIYPWIEIQERIENTGRRAVLSGFGGQSAVALIDCGNDNIKGVIRFTGIGNTGVGCVVDGVLDGLPNKDLAIHIHECGDLSKGCERVGDVYNINNQPVGNLANITSDPDGRAKFKFVSSSLPIWDIIGRSLVVKEINADQEKKLACGIIARSAGIFQNYKKICACDGVTLWDERDRPLAGSGRRKNDNMKSKF